jgi:putative hydrolase of HD superfamily
VHAGDITPHDGVSPEAKYRLEKNSLERLLASHPGSKELQELWEDYALGESPEARFVKACDKVDMALQATRYQSLQGDLDLSEFLESALRKLSGSDLDGFL